MDTNGYDDALDLKLVAELQAWSVEEARAHPAPSSTQPASTLAEGQSKGDLLSRQQANAKPLKHRPKPQPPREPTPNPPPTGVADANPDANPMDDADLMDQDEDDDEYVYDTYIREPELSTSTRTSTNPNTTTTLSSIQAPEAENSGLNVGYLIIRAQDTEAWEEFLSDGEGDSEGEWESSDSNGTYILLLSTLYVWGLRCVLDMPGLRVEICCGISLSRRVFSRRGLFGKGVQLTRVLYSGGLPRERLPRGRGWRWEFLGWKRRVWCQRGYRQ